MTWLIIALACFAVALLLNVIKTDKLSTKVEKLIKAHNGLCDTCEEQQSNLIDEFNERVDEINKEFGDVYKILNANKEFADDVVDTMELMCDTDELIIDRINDIEEDLALLNAEVDDIIVELFSEEPEEAGNKKNKKETKKEKKTKKK